MSELEIGNLRAIAYHLEKGRDNGGIEREPLALFLRSIAETLEQQQAKGKQLRMELRETATQKERLLKTAQKYESEKYPACIDRADAAEAEVERLREENAELRTVLKGLYGTVGQKAWLRRWPNINARVRTILGLAQAHDNA